LFSLKTTLNNGLEMPVFGLGVFLMKEEGVARDSVKWALEAGYRSIDTAAIYGNEIEVGDAIKESNIAREDIFLTTKVWNEDQRKDRVQEAFNESLERLKVDYVDLYLIHWPVKEKYESTWKELEKIYKSGRAKAIGVSNFHIHHLEDIKKISDIVPAVNQVECHPYLSQPELREYCKKANIQLEAWSPLGASKNDLFQNKIIVDIAEKYGKSPAQIIIRWDIDSQIITIPKSSNQNRIIENGNVFDFKLTENEIKAIDSLNKDARVGSSPDSFTF
jgi:methylglyoxal/glyoxal reductase